MVERHIPGDLSLAADFPFYACWQLGQIRAFHAVMRTFEQQEAEPN